MKNFLKRRCQLSCGIAVVSFSVSGVVVMQQILKIFGFSESDLDEGYLHLLAFASIGAGVGGYIMSPCFGESGWGGAIKTSVCALTATLIGAGIGGAICCVFTGLIFSEGPEILILVFSSMVMVLMTLAASKVAGTTWLIAVLLTHMVARKTGRSSTP